MSLPTHCNHSRLWVDKHRPQLINEMIIPKVHQTELQSLSRSGEPIPPLFFHGGPGTGKTSAVYAFIRSHPDFSGSILYINGSDENDISVVRDKIYTFATSPTLFQTSHSTKPRGPLRFIVIDELDYMKMDAQRALKALVQTSPVYSCFCFICNYIHKIEPSLFMKCKTFSFYPLPRDHIVSFIRNICAVENLLISDTVIEFICNTYKSDMRGIVYFLQYYHKKNSPVTNIIKWPSVFTTLSKKKNISEQNDWIQMKIDSSGMTYIEFMTEYIYFLFTRKTKTHNLHASQIEQLRTVFQTQHNYDSRLFVQTILDILSSNSQ